MGLKKKRKKKGERAWIQSSSPSAAAAAAAARGPIPTCCAGVDYKVSSTTCVNPTDRQLFPPSTSLSSKFFGFFHNFFFFLHPPYLPIPSSTSLHRPRNPLPNSCLSLHGSFSVDSPYVPNVTSPQPRPAPAPTPPHLQPDPCRGCVVAALRKSARVRADLIVHIFHNQRETWCVSTVLERKRN